MKRIKITDEQYEMLISHGETVPVIRAGSDSYPKLSVGGEYMVFSTKNKEGVHIRCTQNCPINIRLKSLY